jgi:hypothetical protein
MKKQVQIKSIKKESDTNNDVVTIKEYADSVCVSRQAIEKAITIGRLSHKAVTRKTINGKSVACIVKSVANVEWVNTDNITAGRRTPEAIEAVDRLKKEMGLEVSNTQPDDEDTGFISYSEAARREKVAKAKMAETLLLKETGQLVDKDVVYRANFDLCRIARDAVMGIADRITDDVMAAGSNRAKVRQMITEACAAALEHTVELLNVKYTNN